MDSFYWRSPISPFLAAALVLGMGVWLVVLYRRQRAQHPLRKTVALLAPKAAVAALVVLACFDPVRRIVRVPDEGSQILVLIDRSSSMETPDAQTGSRATRAAKLLEELQTRLGSAVIWEAYEFDQQVRPYEAREPRADPVRETDLGASLATAADKPDVSKYLGIVVITDGGDEMIQNVRLPQAPVYIAGVGSDPGGWDDVAIDSLEVPAIVETQSRFTVATEIVVRRGSGGLASHPTQAQVLLEERAAEGWLVRSAAPVDLRMDRQRVELSVESPTERRLRDYRLRIEPVAGELSALNNVRAFPVEVGRDKLPILLFAQEVGWDFSTVRKELARDPSLALTTLYRISEDRFVVQDHRQDGDQALTAGFPTEKEVLDLYRCVILGSFPASQWQSAQMQALVEYVREGGAVIFLGGESSYAQGRYAGTAIEPLFPWRLEGADRESRIGQFAVSVPAPAISHRIVSEMAPLLTQSNDARIESLNTTGPLRSGAVTLLETNAGGAAMPVVALQHYGQGYSLAVATDTLWKWTRTSQTLSETYSRFWRQAVRNVSQWREGERFLSVEWDQPRYRPGERANAIIRVAGQYGAGQVHLKANLRVGRASSHDSSAASGDARPTESASSEPLDIVGILGAENEFRTSVVFRERGEYVFSLTALAGEKPLESYEKTFSVRPTLNEGARLEVDHAFLDYLAAQSGGVYFREGDFPKLAETLRGHLVDQAVAVDMPLVQHNRVYVGVLLIVLALEWTLRRKMNLF